MQFHFKNGGNVVLSKHHSKGREYFQLRSNAYLLFKVCDATVCVGLTGNKLQVMSPVQQCRWSLMAQRNEMYQALGAENTCYKGQFIVGFGLFILVIYSKKKRKPNRL